MRNPLDLNNLPDDFLTKLPLDDSSSASSRIYRKKKNGAKSGKTKVYECRFCSLKFGKSQALGGHMNRHRLERETETLNQARQLLFSTDNLLTLPAHQLGVQSAVHGGYHYPAGFNISHVYPPRLFSGSSSTANLPPPPRPPPPRHQQMYSSLPSHPNISYLSQHHHNPALSVNNHFTDHYVSNNPHFSIKNSSCASGPRPDVTYN